VSAANAPPPLPAAAGFVTVLGRISIVLAALGVLWALAQMLLVLLLPDALAVRAAAQPEVPAAVAWTLQHRNALALAMLALALLFLVVAWGLLKRREWGRRGFITLLLLGAAANFAALLLIDPFFDGLHGMFPAQMLDTPEGRQFIAQMRFNRNLTWASGLLGAVGIAALHGWIVWKLCTAAVRAEFGRNRA